MFDVLTRRLGTVFAKLTGHNKLSEAMLDSALSEIKMALLEADVSLSVVKQILADVKEKSIGVKILDSVKPAEQIAKIVYDELCEILGGEFNFPRSANGQIKILMAGLQGTGKTTSAAKLANWFRRQGKSVILASTDIYRPAAKEQLEILANRIGVDSLPIIAGEKPVDTARRAIATSNDVIIIDTAGRLQIDSDLMAELKEVAGIMNPDEVILTADCQMGQQSVNIAREFNNVVPISGIILTRADGDAKAGAAISMKVETGAPIVFIGTGEGIDALDKFHPDRIASQILGMGDVITLVEKAEANIKEEDAKAMAEKMFSGEFDLSDMLNQIRQMKKLGSIGGLMKLIPGMSKMSAAIKDKISDGEVNKQEAIILSMTPRERAKPDTIFASRKQRIANGAGVSVRDVESLLARFNKTKQQMKQMQSFGGLSGMMDMMKKMNPGG
jgi:signal recognition particle subunit SRP54